MNPCPIAPYTIAEYGPYGVECSSLARVEYLSSSKIYAASNPTDIETPPSIGGVVVVMFVISAFFVWLRKYK